ncbi:MAG TPA: DUF6132 family protein, partial [Chitinophagaceae bacterium]|nr:DUF6132 family protein [Chitinophagaceae bacterium]
IFLGGAAGYLYYHFRACPNGTCMITSRPLNSILYGMVMGFLLQNIVRSEKKIHPKSNSR